MNLVGRALRSWRRFYGENPLHLLALIGSFALVGYSVSFAARSGTPTLVLLALWFTGAVVGHDLMLFPLYALADRSLLAGRWAHRKLRRSRPVHLAAINYIRMPALGSAVLLLIYLPTITGHAQSGFQPASGLGAGPFLPRWLLVTGVLFLGSAALYALRLARNTISGRTTRRAHVSTHAAPADPPTAPDPEPEPEPPSRP